MALYIKLTDGMMQRSTIELIDVKICIYCENKSRMQVLKIELQMVELDRIKKHHIQWRSQDFLSSRCGWVGGAGQGKGGKIVN